MFAYLIGLDNDIVSLTCMDVEVGSLVGLNCNEISADNGQLVVINVENETSLSRTAILLEDVTRRRGIIILPVDDSEQMLLACLDDPSGRITLVGVKSVCVLAIEEVVAGC